MSVEITSGIKTLLQDNVFISTRPLGSSGELKTFYQNAGATFIECPMIELAFLALPQNDAQLLQHTRNFDWIIFTSANGVKYFYQHLRQLNTSFTAVKFAVIGAKTNAALEREGEKADFVCENSDSKHFTEELKAVFMGGFPKTLWPTGNLSPEQNQNNFKKISNLSRINVYKTSYAKTMDKRILNQIVAGDYTLILLYSPSALHNLYTHVKSIYDIKKIRVACIGLTTHKACLAMGIQPLVRSKTASNHGMIEAVNNYLLEIKGTK